MRAALARFWAEFWLDRQLRCLVLEERYHAQALAFHAARKEAVRVALVSTKERLKLVTSRAHLPSLTLVDGSRR
jgi:hypothetical protein